MSNMRVICIDPAPYNVLLNAVLISPVALGESYEVLGRECHWGKVYFILKGMDPRTGFNSDCFLQCSDLDEMELINHPIKRRK